MRVTIENLCYTVPGGPEDGQPRARKGRKARKTILHDVSFAAQSGSFVSILGASGAGKSTLLKIIAGIDVQDSGEILFDDQPIGGVASHKRNIGVVFQDIRLFPHLTVGQNVAFPCKMHHMAKAETAARVSDLLSRVQLAGFEDRRPASLSGGQAQRVAFARALAARPQLFLLDEPFSGLDENLREDMRQLLRTLSREERVTTFMVTHDASEALALSDVVVYMSDGRVVQVATPEQLYTRPATAEIAACFGACSMLAGNVRGGVFECGPLRMALSEDAKGEGPATAVVRREGCEAAPVAGGADDAHDASSLPVRSVTYLGSETLASLEVAGQTLDVPLPRASTLRPGDAASLRIDPAYVFVYPSA